MTRTSLLTHVQAQGFDRSYRTQGAVRVRCSQCETLVINGTPCHETGCPNTPHKEKDEDNA